MFHSKIKIADISGETSVIKATENTEITVDSLREWVKEKQFPSPYFDGCFSNDVPAYLDRNHLSHSNRLYYAIRAWEAVATVEDTSGKTPKQLIKAWLERYAEDLSTTAKDEIAKIVNWKPDGGAPKTPTTSKKKEATP